MAASAMPEPQIGPCPELCEPLADYSATKADKEPSALDSACWACLGYEGGAGPLNPVVHVRQSHVLQRPESVLHTLQGQD